ncbi:1,2-phenylacetyl-CoA epoxidase subunit PaaD [Nonlabens marinus]|uniref:Phenylacetate-CoA oxygenase, PaaJ subunit n=1 Tax=Nonlabens marinus S1-08 TaxID=1454201 RepID=W8VXB3_9FLAO|nr:1,2-phenylacetyl-CoA epoxidase subunit PaaD [Nonlabens marinus]BAO55627.1 phenylacetate-CoA oxygenase, PaaJ subunit [Nonlabens marinus S1-08]
MIQDLNISEELLEILESVKDPEIPVLNVVDLGVIRDVEVNGKEITIKLTPTYSGCPAMDVIGDDLERAFEKEGYTTNVQLIMSPPWTTDWITERGRKALEEYGIAAPLDETADKDVLLNEKKLVKCTNCGSTNTKLVSQFGSTACKAMFQCEDCHEPFDYFKCLK